MNKDQLITELIISGLEGDKRGVRALATAAIQYFKKEKSPELERLSKAISFVDVGHSAFRSVGLDSIPQDKDTALSLVKVISPNTFNKVPIFNHEIQKRVESFIAENKRSNELISLGVKPSSTFLLTGKPGVGKTILASFIAKELGKQLLVLDLAGAVSSFLGKTGQNLKAVFDFAIETNSILFLDEFDSIAKRRDDPTDLGELKRIVNILLKEIEDWPSNSILMAATNHPELLDRAIWRRFDDVLEIPLPEKHEREAFLSKELENYKISKEIKTLALEFSSGATIADLERVINKFKRRSIVEESDNINSLLFEEIVIGLSDKSTISNAELCKRINKIFPKMKLKDISELSGIGVSTVHYHLKGRASEQ